MWYKGIVSDIGYDRAIIYYCDGLHRYTRLKRGVKGTRSEGQCGGTCTGRSLRKDQNGKAGTQGVLNRTGGCIPAAFLFPPDKYGSDDRRTVPHQWPVGNLGFGDDIRIYMHQYQDRIQIGDMISNIKTGSLIWISFHSYPKPHPGRDMGQPMLSQPISCLLFWSTP